MGTFNRKMMYSEKVSMSKTTANAFLSSTFKPFAKNYELIVDCVNDGPSDHPAGCGTALGDFMGQLLNSALLIVDEKGTDDGVSDDKNHHEEKDDDDIPNQEDKEYVVVHDNAKLPFQVERRKIRRDRFERQYSERAESKRETRWSSIGRNQRCAGLTIPSRSCCINYSSHPAPSAPAQTRDKLLATVAKSTPRTPTESVNIVDTVPTHPRCKRRCST
jgi:hypothetical protein